MGARDPNTGPHAYRAISLLTEPCPQSCLFLLNITGMHIENELPFSKAAMATDRIDEGSWYIEDI